MVSSLSCSTHFMSLRSVLYQRLRLLIGFSRTVGMGSLLTWYLSLAILPLTIERLRDLMGLNSIRAHLMFSWSLPSRRLVHALVVAIIVMLSIYTLIGGRLSPLFNRSPPTTHQDTRMISSIAMVNASGDMVQPAIIPISRCCQRCIGPCTGLCCYAELEVAEVSFDQPYDALWDLEEAECSPQDRMRH